MDFNVEFSKYSTVYYEYDERVLRLYYVMCFLSVERISASCYLMLIH